MAVIEKIREVMQRNEEKKKGLRKSILMLMLEWKNFEEDIDISATCLVECFNELEAREKHLTLVQESVMVSSKDLDLIRESVETKEEEFRAFREREIRDLESKWKEFSLAREGYDEVVKLSEEKLSEQEKLVERLWGETEFEHKKLEDLQKSIENRFREISMKEQEFEERSREFNKIQSWIRKETDDLHLKERKFMERVEEFDIREKRLQSMEKKMETKERDLDSVMKDVMVKENCLHIVKKELREKETMLASVRKELREKEHNLDSIRKEHRKKETALDSVKKQLVIKLDRVFSVNKELELKDKSLDSIQKKLEFQEQELASLKERREGELDSNLKAYKQQLEELDSREKSLDSLRMTMQKCDAEFQLEKENFQNEQGLLKKRTEDIALKEIEIELRCRELKQREELIDNQFKLIEEKEKLQKTSRQKADATTSFVVSDVQKPQHETRLKLTMASACPSDTKGALTSSIPKASTCELPHSDAFAVILMGMGGKNLLTFLNNHLEELELLRFEVYRALTLSTDAGMLVLEALGGFYPPKEETELSNRNIIRKSCILLLEELMRISPALTSEAKLKASKLSFEWKERMMAEVENHLPILVFLLLVGAYGLATDFDKNELESLCSIVANHGQIVTQISHALGISEIYDEPLSMSVEKKSQQIKGNILHLSSDPAKVVLDALKKCYSFERRKSILTRKRKRGKLNNGLSMKNFSELLDQLREVSPKISPQVKIEATEYAVEWRATLTEPREVVGLFNLLATFELPSLFDPYVLLGLLEMVERIAPRAANIIKILGLVDKIPCFIESLIWRREWLKALAYIYEFELVGSFPPVPLLKRFVSCAVEQDKQIRDNGGCSRKPGEKGISCELYALRAAVKHIRLHNLQSEYSPDPLRARISELEQEMVSVRSQPISQVQKQKKQQKVERLHQQPQHPNQFMQHPIYASGVPPPLMSWVNPTFHHPNFWHPGYFS